MLQNIARIEELCEAANPVEEVDFFQGPFGAFKTVSDQGPAGSTEYTASTGNESVNISSQSTEEQPWWSDPSEALELLLGRASDLDLWTFVAESACPLDDPGQISFPAVLNHSTQDRTVNTRHDRVSSPNTILDHLAISRCVSPVPNLDMSIPQSAWFLIQHYTSSVLRSLSPFDHKKTPWDALFMPVVKLCIAGLKLQESLDDATLCVFYGTLAISALSLGGRWPSQGWVQKSNAYRWRALEHMKAARQPALHGIKKAKYKTQLMALLTMVQLSIASGNRNDTEYFLVETEKFIRIHGLNRKKSRKVRLLHHCYTYERIFFESTSAGGQQSIQYHASVRKAIESSGASSYSKDSLSFRLPSIENLETDMLLVKDAELGENDLHIQYPGLWPSSQYEEIFGLPERYVLFVSLIVRLAREKDGELGDDEPGVLTMKAFTSRAKAIETCLKQQRPPQPRRNNAVDYLIAATHSAVLIYFYRKIHDVDAFMLQQQVSDVRSALQSYDSLNLEKGSASVRLLWPAFIAACESENENQRQFFATWFESAAEQSGLRLFDVTMANVERIWQQKRDNVGVNITYQSCIMESGQSSYLPIMN